MPEDTDKKGGPVIGAQRPTPAPAPQQEPKQPAQQAWVPAQPSQKAQAADQQQPEAPAEQAQGAPAPAVQGPGTQVTYLGSTTEVVGKKPLTATEKLQAGMQGILSGAGGSKEGQMIGEAVGQGIKNLFGQGKKDGAGGTQVGPGRLGPSADEAAQAGGPIIGGHREQGAKQEAGGLDVGGSLGKKVGGMIGSAVLGEKGKSVGQMLGKIAGNAAGQAANVAIDHARGIGGNIGSAIGGAIAGEEGAAKGKELGKKAGSGVTSVRDTLAAQGVDLGPKQAPGKHGHGIK